jgi:hypothetical protein
VSSIIEFFVAPDDSAAAGVAKRGPGGRYESATYRNFSVWSTLVEWESILASRSLVELMTSGGPDVVAGSDGFPVVLVASHDLHPLRWPALTTTRSEQPPSGGSNYERGG